jgi:hypothetical protein
MISILKLVGGLTKKDKENIRRAFTQAFDLGFLASVGIIKKYYPDFDSKLDTHWKHINRRLSVIIRAKKYFSECYSTPASIAAIREKFPTFDHTNNTHWENLIDKCVQSEMTDRELYNAQITAQLFFIAEQGFYTGRMDYLCGTSTQIFHSDRLIGTFGYSTIQKQYYCSQGRHGRNYYFPTAQQAIDWVTSFIKGKTA